MAQAMKYADHPASLVEKLYQNGLVNGDGTGFLQKIINKKIILDSNRFFWQENFTVEGSEYKIDLRATQKNPAFTVRQKTSRPVPTADAMAPLSETAPLDGEGYTEQTGSIYQFGKGIYDTSMTKLELEARLRELGGVDGDMLDGYVRGIADLTNTHNYTLSHLAAQVISRGGAYDNTKIRGFSAIKVEQPSYIPQANFKTAGTLVWTDPDCDIPTQMQAIENQFKEENGISVDEPFVWQIPYDMLVTTFLKNKYVIEQVNRYIRFYAKDKVVVVTNGKSGLDTDVISVEDLLQYSRTADISKISPIMVVKESQTVQDITTIRTVQGWDAGKVVLRPLGEGGKCGVVVHAEVADVEIVGTGEINNLVSVSTAKILNFLYVLNVVSPDGMYKKYITKVLGRYAPVLNESPMHVVVDTTTADS